MSSYIQPSPTRAQALIPGSPGIHGRPSYTHRDTTRTLHNSLDINEEKYDPNDHAQYLEPTNQIHLDADADHTPNGWAKIRHLLREPAAEFLGTMLLVIFGTAVNCQVALSSNTRVSTSPKGDYLSISFGWAVGVALGAWVSGGISGGHINPAVTLASAIFRGFSWKKVPSYILAQVLGACTGAGLVYANYYRAIDIFEGGMGVRTVPGSASLFATFAMDHLSNVQCFYSEALGTAILVLVIFAVTDKRNSPPPSGMVPLAIFITILGEAACLGMQTGFALNPARDLGPRLMCWMAGYGRQVWNYRSQYWLYTPIIGPIVGAIVGSAIYDAFIFTGPESIFNKRVAAARLRHLQAPAEGKGKSIPSSEETV
ncbi:aquaporin-like protein [Rhizoctonia solani]|nr:aquaporin-like protein [Rhizoctonia solani]